MQFDAALFLAIHSLADKNPVLDWALIFFAEIFPFIVAGAFVAELYKSDQSHVRQMHIFSLAIVSAVVARIITEIMHELIARPRPYLTFHFTPLVPENSYSFPSGHAAFFFGFAVAIWLQNRVWGRWFLLCATIIALARVAVGVHYPSDVLGGAVLGCAVALGLNYAVKAFSKTGNG